MPVRAELADLLPLGGLRRGSTISVRGSNSLLLALLATATSSGSWAAVIGLPELGLTAAEEFGVVPQRLAVVPKPGAELVSVVAAMLDGMDLVVVGAAGLGRLGRRGNELAKRLSVRARHRGAVLIAAGGVWPGVDLELSCTEMHWFGLGEGHGYLAEGELEIAATGRGAAARSREITAVLPCAAGANVANPNSATPPRPAPLRTAPLQADPPWIAPLRAAPPWIAQPSVQDPSNGPVDLPAPMSVAAVG